jgi:hypothetical protein
MTRWTLAALMALAALGAVAVLDLGSATAEAAPSVSPFAGTYDWNSWAVTISDGGRITSSNLYIEHLKGSFSGRVSADGSYSFTITWTGYICIDERCRTKIRVNDSYKWVGNLALDANGNIVGTSDAGGSFVWLRR